MGRSDLEEHNGGSWHPALRPNDDQHQGSSPIQPSLRATRNSYCEKPNIDAVADPSYDKQQQDFLNFVDEVRQDSSSRLDDRPHKIDDQGTKTAEPKLSPEDNLHKFRQPVTVKDPTLGPSSVEDAFGPDQRNMSVPENLDQKDDARDKAGLSLGEETREETVKNARSEISSDGDDERLDPAWFIGPSDTQHIPLQVERSSSFPALPPASGLSNADVTGYLPGTQAEATMIDTETDVAPDNGVVELSEHTAPWQITSNEATIDGEEGSFFTRISSTNQAVEQPSNAEARFEEGLPLVDSESRPNDDLQEQSRPAECVEDQRWSRPENENDATFFDQPTAMISGDTTHPLPAHLARKATSDLFNSLSFSSDQAPDSPTGAADEAKSVTSTQQQKNGQSVEKTLDVKANGGTDISALWEAVLDDDDFLAEDSDGLLPDSSPQSSPGSPSSFLGSLNDGTGSQEPDVVLSRSDSRSSNDNKNKQGHQFPARQTSNPYAPHQPSSSDLAQMSTTTYGNVGVSRSNLAPANFGQNSFQGQFQRPPAPLKAESFVDQSKGGYKSPYDLPMDLSKPRKRIQMHQPPPPTKAPAPPPRSSSMTSDQRPGSATGPLQSPFSPTNATFEGEARPQSSQHPAPQSSVNRGVSSEPPVALKAKASSPSFFEELPITVKPRPPTVQGRYNPAQTGAIPPRMPPTSPAALQLQPSAQMPPPPVHTQQSPFDSHSQYQLQRPERVDPYADVALQPSVTPLVSHTRYSPAPPTSQTAPPPSRYSPAPPSSQMGPPPSAPSRYSPAPPQSNSSQAPGRYASQPQPSQPSAISQSRYPSQPAPPVANVLPFQPRTSSPLAYHGKKSDAHVDVSHGVNVEAPSSPPTRVSPPQRIPYPRESPQSSGPPVLNQGFAPPRRSQTQSPGKRGPVSTLISTSNEMMQRPASVHGPSSPITSASPYQSFPPAQTSVRQRGLSQHLNFISPTDESGHDELQRWHGSPIFRFGFGGTVLSTFPKHLPRFSTGSAMPMIKPMAGEVLVRNAKEIFPLPEYVAKFPGPLRSKSKKKEVLAWLSERIAALENMPLPQFSQQLPDPIKRHDEKILMWKVVRVIVEHDGAVEGSVDVRTAMNLVLSPESTSPDNLASIHNPLGFDVAGIYRPAGAITKSEIIDPAAVESIRKGLLRGEREKAVWTAVDNRLWAHAMLLSSTLDRSIWKQVAHEFVRQEVKLVGANAESLAALFEIFAGNLEESIDELVPPSARAGLQMISKVDGAGPTKSALDGLDRWRETLSLVLNNRSPEDQKALAALGRLLATYGRIEASHICHLFASSPMLPSVFGGSDDPQASIVLLGADHRNQLNENYFSEDAILLTEVYEFASSILASNSKAPLLPHLQAYKLHRVRRLAEAGFKTEAQAYCDTIGASLRSTTKLSPYYHPQFLAELDDLTQRLSQAPAETSSWISKPTMGKVSDSMWNKFTTFVAGDESDAASTSSGRDATHEFGPFAKVSGTPTVSRPGSSSDLYGSYATSAPHAVPNVMAGSRYAPSGQYSARSSSELTRGRPSLDAQRSPSNMQPAVMQKSPHDPNVTLNQQSYMTPSIPTQATSPHAPLGASPPVQPHQSTAPQPSYMPMVHPEGQMYNPRQPGPYVHTPPPEQAQPYMQTLSSPAQLVDAETIQAPSVGGDSAAEFIPQIVPPQTISSYGPPPLQSYSSYEPPSTEYVPFRPEPSSDSESENRKPQKKSFMNDDDDDSLLSNFAPHKKVSAAADDTALAAARKKVNDDAAEAAFRAAAEADAAKDNRPSSQDKTLKAKSSWFGSLFARKESDSLDAGGNKTTGSGSGGGEGQKVIRAKLGEESSFYYDKELKKWINKKDPASMQQSAKATPPPPKGPLGRVVSESLGSAGPGGGGPPRSGLTAPPPSLNTSRPTSSNGPPSRAGTPSELGTSIAEMLPPVGATGEGAQSAPPTTTPSFSGAAGLGIAPPTAAPTGRPTSAARNTTTSDIDDLLGGPPGAGPRKPGGTLKGKKARGRYVDVMAK